MSATHVQAGGECEGRGGEERRGKERKGKGMGGEEWREERRGGEWREEGQRMGG